jgi:hypothetical protein
MSPAGRAVRGLAVLSLILGAGCRGGSEASAGDAGAAGEPPALLARLAAGRDTTDIGRAHDERQCGVSWVAGRPVTAADFDPLVADHVNWITETPFGWEGPGDSATVRLVTSGRIYWGETDSGLVATARLARRRGIHVLLKPHVWVRGSEPDRITRADDAAWERWFASYRRFIVHYAELAEAESIEALCIGTELSGSTVEREADWRRVIAAVRAVYHGRLTYAANWYQEFETIRFWDALDFVGIQAYFPLAEREGATVEQLVAGWRPHFEAIERVHEGTGKPVVFTEVGYRSVPDAAVKPWVWPSRRGDAGETPDPAAQARAYEAFFRVFWKEPWVAGAYVWKWFPGEGTPREEANGTGFSPRGKPAERVMAAWYGLR